MKKYLVVTHDWQRTSAGVRALHRLCHYLNLAGCDAYVTSTVRNPDLVTPVANANLQAEIAESGIVVYPEVEAGNPLRARQVVRYLLNVPGRIRGDAMFPHTEALWAYSGLLRSFVHNPLNVLTVPVVDTAIFNPFIGIALRGVKTLLYWGGKGCDLDPRLYVERYVGKGLLPLESGTRLDEITFDQPASWPALASAFRDAELFVTFTPYTMLTIEARLCGCPVVVIPNGVFTREAFARARPGSNGLAWGLDAGEIARAQRTVGQFRQDYQESVAAFFVQLDRFIDKTQRWVR